MGDWLAQSAPYPERGSALFDLIDRAAGRARLIALVAGLPTTIAAMLAAAGLAVALARSGPSWLVPITIGLGIVGPTAWLWYKTRQKPAAIDLARRLDRANQTNELLSSAIAARNASSTMLAEVRRQAEIAARQLPAASIGHLRPTGGAGLGAALVLFGLLASLQVDPGRSADPIQAPSNSSPMATAVLPNQKDQMRSAAEQLRAALDPYALERAETLGRIAETLVKEPITRSAGRALAGGDLDAASAELAKLADAIGELNPSERAALQAALAGASARAGSDPLLTQPLLSAVEGLEQHRLGSAAAGLDELAAALTGAAQQMAAQESLQSRLRDLNDQLNLSDPVATPGGDPTTGGRAPGLGPGLAAPGVGSIARISAAGVLEIVPLLAESEPARIERRQLQPGIEKQPDRNPSAGVFGFAQPGPAPRSPNSPEERALLRSYYADPDAT